MDGQYLPGFLDKPHRCPVCWRCDYNVLSFGKRRVIVGSCPGCEAKWYGVRTKFLNFVKVQEVDPR